MAKEWKVVRKSDCYFVEGLPGEDWSESLVEPIVTSDTELFHINKFGEYVDDVDDAGDLQDHLYSLYNCDDRVKDGDVFVTPFGRFYCYGVHVATKQSRDLLIEAEKRGWNGGW